MKKITKTLFTSFVLTPVVATPIINLTSCNKSTFQISTCKSLIELHNHLDGCVTLDAARKLSAAIQKDDRIKPEGKAEADTSKMTDEELAEKIQVKKNNPSLENFLSKFVFINHLIVTPENAEALAKGVCDALFDAGVIYAELRFCPQFFYQSASKVWDTTKAPLPSTEDFLISVIKGVNESKLKNSCGLILCLNRISRDSTEHNLILELCKKYKDQGVCGIDVATDEANNPIYEGTEAYNSIAPILKQAKTDGINITMHAGESQLPNTNNAIKDINAAIDLGATRIGHGTYAQYDEATMKRLSDNNITLEVCPYSNYMTKGIESYESHPIKKFAQNYIPICVSTDDPGVENTTVWEEWQRAIDTFGISKENVKDILIQSALCSFTTPQKKQSLIYSIIADFNKK